MPSAQNSILIDCPVADVFSVIADVESYPQFLPAIKRAKVLRKGGRGLQGWVKAAFEVELLHRLAYSVLIHLDPPHRLSWKLIEGQMMKSNEGEWKLVSQGKGKTRATFSTTVELSVWLPQRLVDSVIAADIPEMLKKFKARCEGGYAHTIS